MEAATRDIVTSRARVLRSKGHLSTEAIHNFELGICKLTCLVIFWECVIVSVSLCVLERVHFVNTSTHLCIYLYNYIVSTTITRMKDPAKVWGSNAIEQMMAKRDGVSQIHNRLNCDGLWIITASGIAGYFGILSDNNLWWLSERLWNKVLLLFWNTIPIEVLKVNSLLSTNYQIGFKINALPNYTFCSHFEVFVNKMPCRTT